MDFTDRKGLFEDERMKHLLVQLNEGNSLSAKRWSFSLLPDSRCVVYSNSSCTLTSRGRRRAGQQVFLSASHQPHTGLRQATILSQGGSSSSSCSLSQPISLLPGQPLTQCKTFCTQDKVRWDSMLVVLITY